MKRFPISRRTLLRGAGAALALPWLEAMDASAAEQQDLPRRMCAVMFPFGVASDTFLPSNFVPAVMIEARMQTPQAASLPLPKHSAHYCHQGEWMFHCMRACVYTV